MFRIASAFSILLLAAFFVTTAHLQADDKEEGGPKKKQGAKESPKAAIFQALDEKANTLTVKAGEKGAVTHPLTNPFKVVHQAKEGKTVDAKVADLKTGMAIGLKMNAEGKAVEVITILQAKGKGKPEGKEAPAPRRPEGKEAPAPKRPEGKEAPAPKRPEGKEAPAPKTPEK
jgi:hypothetical protein